MTAAPEISCNLCGMSDFRVMERDEAPFQVLKCLNCSLVFVYPFPQATHLRDHYDELYYRDWIYAQRSRRRKMWAKRMEHLAKYRMKGRLLDVGCGDGAFLAAAREAGWEVSGTETSPYACDFAGKLLGADIFCGELTEARYPDDHYDAVTLWHVLEHVTDPLGYLTEVHRILKPSGVLILAVPNVHDFVMQAAYLFVKRRRLRLFSISDREIHLYHFSDRTLAAYLRKTNFRLIVSGPDYGIVDISRKVVNALSTLPYYAAGLKIFNAFEVHAAPLKATAAH